MNAPNHFREDPDTVFESAEWYDQSINWAARLSRELPVLTDLFGTPARGGVLDAGCGTGRQAIALAERGYRLVGADASNAMLAIARRRAADVAGDVGFIQATYGELFRKAGGGFDGLYCLGNALAAAGSRQAVEDAISRFAECLRSGGRLFLQLLNFQPMREEVPCVRGPRVTVEAGREYISTRHFHFFADHCRVTNVTVWKDDGWHQRAHGGQLYPVDCEELHAWCDRAGFRVDHTWGSYAQEEFDARKSTDLIVVATRA